MSFSVNGHPCGVAFSEDDNGDRPAAVHNIKKDASGAGTCLFMFVFIGACLAKAIFYPMLILSLLRYHLLRLDQRFLPNREH